MIFILFGTQPSTKPTKNLRRRLTIFQGLSRFGGRFQRLAQKICSKAPVRSQSTCRPSEQIGRSASSRLPNPAGQAFKKFVARATRKHSMKGFESLSSRLTETTKPLFEKSKAFLSKMIAAARSTPCVPFVSFFTVTALGVTGDQVAPKVAGRYTFKYLQRIDKVLHHLQQWMQYHFGGHYSVCCPHKFASEKPKRQIKKQMKKGLEKVTEKLMKKHLKEINAKMKILATNCEVDLEDLKTLIPLPDPTNPGLEMDVAIEYIWMTKNHFNRLGLSFPSSPEPMEDVSRLLQYQPASVAQKLWTDTMMTFNFNKINTECNTKHDSNTDHVKIADKSQKSSNTASGNPPSTQSPIDGATKPKSASANDVTTTCHRKPHGDNDLTELDLDTTISTSSASAA